MNKNVLLHTRTFVDLVSIEILETGLVVCIRVSRKNYFLNQKGLELFQNPHGSTDKLWKQVLFSFCHDCKLGLLGPTNRYQSPIQYPKLTLLSD